MIRTMEIIGTSGGDWSNNRFLLARLDAFPSGLELRQLIIVNQSRQWVDCQYRCGVSHIYVL
jgi:hypothetical protein